MTLLTVRNRFVPSPPVGVSFADTPEPLSEAFLTGESVRLSYAAGGTPVAEAATLALLAIGLSGIGIRRR